MPDAAHEPFSKFVGDEPGAGVGEDLARLTPTEAVAGGEGEEEEWEGPKQDGPDDAERWRMLSLVDEHGRIPDGALVRAWEEARRMPVDTRAWPSAKQPAKKWDSVDVGGIQPAGWTWLGPGNVGGRIRSIVIHPTDTQTMWVGSVSGGIWKTTNGGASWVALDDFMANLAVSTMVIDPNDPNTLYAGTGEGFSNSGSRRGAGVFKTTDGGATWAQLPSTANINWLLVNRITISPDGQVILAGTATGIWRSTDGGANWSQRSTIRTLDLNFDPTNGSKAIASGTAGAGARYSTDGGLSWTLATGLPTTGRIEVAYARSNTSVVYAGVEINSGEVWRSSDGGQTYSLVNTGTNYLGTQGWHNNIVWVDPTNPNIVIVGGIELWRSTNGGVNFTRISNSGSTPGTSAHADNHMIVESPLFNGASNKTVFFGNDGGIYRASDVYTVGNNPPSYTAGWQELNNNLGITQFYGGAGNATTGYIVGGTQDNGTQRYTGGTEGWNMTAGSDGGWCAADQADPNYFYGETQWMGIHRSTNGGVSSSLITNPSLSTGLTDAVSNVPNFISPFILDPNNSNTLLAGGPNLWRSTNAKATPPSSVSWSIIKTTIGSNISAIAVARGNSDIIWVGHNNGNVYYTTNGTSASPTWTQVDTGAPGLPDRMVTRLIIDPTNSSRVYATFGGFLNNNVWRTDNSGATWTGIMGNLPSLPVRTIAVWDKNPSFLYVGTEVGVYASADGGASWSGTNDGPNNCSVDELFWMGDKLVAATHGRGMFSINLAVNGAPSVSITSPATGARFAPPATVQITATASDPDGSVAKVEFFANGNLIGTVFGAPYQVTLTNAPSGAYSITARATDDAGNTMTSSGVNIGVTPVNDNFAGAQLLGGCFGSLTAATGGATTESGEPSHDPGGSTGGGSVWYQWIAPSSGSVTINTTGGVTDFDTVLAVYTGNSVGGLQVIQKNDDVQSGVIRSSAVTFNALAGTTYKIAVDGWAGETGNFVLNWSQPDCVVATPTVQLSQPTYSVAEGGSFATVTVTRTGDPSPAVTVKYQTSDSTDVNFQCNPATAGQATGQASRKCDYHLASGRLRFAAGETSKQIILSIVDDVYVEGTETFTLILSGATGASLGSSSTSTISITDNDAGGAANPIDGTAFYVRQLYVDLLNREPDAGGWNGWTSRIDLCGQAGQPPPPCDRVTVGGDGFLRSGEFFDRQFFVLRLYWTAFGRILLYDEVGDLAYVSGFLTAADLELNKQELVAEIMSRNEFTNKYGGLGDAAYVDALLQTAAFTVPQSVRDGWVTALGSNSKTRAQVFREISERTEVGDKYLKEAQVVSAYYGFFTRNPDGAYFNYLERLNSGEINLGDLANAFINAAEYRQRFGP
ncbi:MAG TPA: Ig-like domain-containing protein [Pyrinomonadaceae bacterium]